MRYQLYENLSCEELLDKFYDLDAEVFGPASREKTLLEMEGKKRFTVFMAYSGDRAAGFKVGYERKVGEYYSWLGGVHPDFRGQGIARELMRLQHELLKKEGYTAVRTHTKNQFRSMLILNLKTGFDILGTFLDKKGEIKIILEKSLN